MDLSHCYLHTLGEAEAQKLAELRARLPEIVGKAKADSEDARALPRQSIWGVAVEEQSEASDIVLLKFLRAEEQSVDKAAARVAATLVFRADCHIDELAKAELPEHFQGHDVIGGTDKDGRPLMISRFGGMDLQKVFGDVEAFVRYRAQLMERAIALLSFKKGDPEDLCQIHDYSGVPLIFQTSEVKRGVTAVTKVFSEHYPEFKGKTIFVNFPAAFSKLFQAFSVLIPERTRKKFLILGEDDQATLFQHICPEAVPEAIGGMLREPGGLSGPCQVVDVKSAEEVTLLEVADGATVLWELRVCAREIAYEVVFVPSGGGEEEVIRKTAAKEYLQASQGIVAGEWTAKAAGAVKCRFRNECAWFKWRLCLCRAQAKP